MSEQESHVMMEIKTLGEQAADHLQNKRRFTNMDWYTLEMILHRIANEAGRLNQAE